MRGSLGDKPGVREREVFANPSFASARVVFVTVIRQLQGPKARLICGNLSPIFHASESDFLIRQWRAEMSAKNNMGWGMRYEEYLKRTTRLDKEIADCLSREIKAANGKGPWYVRLFPGLRSTTIEVANRKRGVLARQRAKLEREMFADPSTIWNADVTAVFRKTVPSSPDAIEHLRSAADAAFDVQR